MRRLREACLLNQGQRSNSNSVTDRRLSLIDMSCEDDSLLPGSCNDAAAAAAGQASKSPQTVFPPSPSVKSGKKNRLSPSPNINLQQDSRYTEELKLRCPSILEEPETLQQNSDCSNSEPKPFAPVFRRSKTVGHNSLRKSLAWDKAFLTGEGVLDLDELPVPTQSSKRLPELPTLELLDFNGNPPPDQFNLTYGHQAQVSAMDERTTNGAVELTTSPKNEVDLLDRKSSEEAEAASITPVVASICPHADSPVGHKEDLTGAVESSPISGVNRKLPVATLPKAAIAKPTPMKNVIEVAVQKGTRLRLPGSFIKLAEKSNNRCQKVCVKEDENACMRREASMPTSILTSKISSVSKRVKDSLGRVLPGTLGRTTQETSRATPECQDLGAEGTLVENCTSNVYAESPFSMPSPSLCMIQTPKKEIASTTMKYLYDANKPKVKSLEETKLKKISSGGIISPSSNIANLPASMKVKMPLKGDTKSQSSGFSAISKYCSNVEEEGTKSHKNLNSNSQKLQRMVCNNTHVSSARNPLISSCKSKPTGLRMPSPKLGFFDSARVLTGAQHSIMSDKADFNDIELTLDSEKYGQPQISVDNNLAADKQSKHSLRSKSHGIPSWKPAQRFSEKSVPTIQVPAVSSGIPSAPHLRSSDNASPTIVSYVSAPTSYIGQSQLLSTISNRPLTPEKKMNGTSDVLGKDRSIYELGEIFSKQATAENVKLELPASQMEMSTSNPMVSSERMKYSCKVNKIDQLSDRVVTSNEDQMQSHTVLSLEPLSFANDCGDKIVKESSVLSLADRCSKDDMADFLSCLPLNEDTIRSPPRKAGSLHSDTTFKCKSHSELSENQAKSLAQPSKQCQEVREDLLTNCTSAINNLDMLDAIFEEMSEQAGSLTIRRQELNGGKPSLECSQGGEPKEIGGQAGSSTQISQEEKGKPPLECGQGALSSVDIQDGSYEEMDKDKYFCSSKEVTDPENQDKEDILDDSLHCSEWLALKASAQNLHISPEHDIALKPCNTNADNSMHSCVASQQFDELKHRSPLSVNEQLLNIANIDEFRGESERDQDSLKKTVSQFASLNAPRSTVLAQENDSPKDSYLYDGSHHKVNKGKMVSDRGLIKKVDSKLLSRKCLSKENVFDLKTAVLEDIPIYSGPVVHSPPNKPSPRPGPWSPVRRTVQQLGPFDCTKYLNFGFVQKSEQ
ncbi:hypothetical protein O6H91_05G117200 [Diphasiastrum complanatum]|uniref:Uncharacterized protein n=1 Tax=Diphasiastrum complanatum TaxID=34168 RepID=A0ACC2DSD1_DIPCM|nr:hypothetical protein O6H91_05G117200 [Diphasiastrum complanatum]